MNLNRADLLPTILGSLNSRLHHACELIAAKLKSELDMRRKIQNKWQGQCDRVPTHWLVYLLYTGAVRNLNLAVILYGYDPIPDLDDDRVGKIASQFLKLYSDMKVSEQELPKYPNKDIRDLYDRIVKRITISFMVDPDDSKATRSKASYSIMDNIKDTLAVDSVTSKNKIGTIGIISVCALGKLFDDKIDQKEKMKESVINCVYRGNNSGTRKDREQDISVGGNQPWDLTAFQPSFSTRHLHSITDAIMVLCGTNVRQSLGSHLKSIVRNRKDLNLDDFDASETVDLIEGAASRVLPLRKRVLNRENWSLDVIGKPHVIVHNVEDEDKEKSANDMRQLAIDNVVAMGRNLEEIVTHQGRDDTTRGELVNSFWNSVGRSVTGDLAKFATGEKASSPRKRARTKEENDEVEEDESELVDNLKMEQNETWRKARETANQLLSPGAERKTRLNGDITYDNLAKFLTTIWDDEVTVELNPDEDNLIFCVNENQIEDFEARLISGVWNTNTTVKWLPSEISYQELVRQQWKIEHETGGTYFAQRVGLRSDTEEHSSEDDDEDSDGKPASEDDGDDRDSGGSNSTSDSSSGNDTGEESSDEEKEDENDKKADHGDPTGSDDLDGARDDDNESAIAEMVVDNGPDTGKNGIENGSDESEPDEWDFTVGWMNLVQATDKSQVRIRVISGNALDTYHSSPNFSFSDVPKCEVRIPNDDDNQNETSMILDLRDQKAVSLWVSNNATAVIGKPGRKKYAAVLHRAHEWKTQKVRHLCAYVFSDQDNLRAPANKTKCVDLIAGWMCGDL